jgi:hypothetical protein
MPLSPHFILPTPCTFMTSHLSRYGPRLPGVRELFPDLFYQQPTVSPHTLPISPTHDPQQCTPYDATNLPSASTSRHLQFPTSDWSTARNTAIGTTDRQYIRTRFNNPPPHHPSHVQPSTHITQRWPDPDVIDSIPTPHTSPRSVSPEVHSPYSQSRQQVECEVGSSSLPDNEQTSSPATSSPHMASNSAEFTPRPTFEQKSVETHSGKKRHKCEVCGSYWGRPSSLKIHMVSHTGVKEFVCSICKQDFGVKSNYTRHIRVHHKDSTEGTLTRAAGRRRRGSRRNQDVGPVRFVDEGPKFQGQ